MHINVNLKLKRSFSFNFCYILLLIKYLNIQSDQLLLSETAYKYNNSTNSTVILRILFILRSITEFIFFDKLLNQK